MLQLSYNSCQFMPTIYVQIHFPIPFYELTIKNSFSRTQICEFVDIRKSSYKFIPVRFCEINVHVMLRMAYTVMRIL